jgi:hypothetical protein
MKKLMLSATALIVFAGSAATVNAAQANTKPSKATLTIKSSMIPPTCPLHTPDGCGIYD